MRIVPQVRRQVPESWRRVLPVPLAAGLYGVLLGLGFTTFILTFAVWALAAVSVALGDPRARRGARPRVRRRPRAAGDRARARSPRPTAATPRTPRWPSARRSCAGCAWPTPSRWRRARVAMTAVAPASAATVVASRRVRPGSRGRRSSPSSVPAPPAPATSGGPTPPSACPAATPRSAPASSAGEPPRARSCSPGPTRSPRSRRYAAPGAGPFAFSDRWVVWLVGQAQLVAQPRDASAPPRTIARARSRRAARPPVDRRRRPSSSTAPARPAPRSACSTSTRGVERAAALRAPRAAQQPVVRRPPPALRALDLHPRRSCGSAPLARRAAPRATARSTAPPRPPAATPATRRATTATAPATGAASRRRSGAAAAGRRRRHAVDDGALGPDAAYVTRLRKRRGATTATLLSDASRRLRRVRLASERQRLAG